MSNRLLLGLTLAISITGCGPVAKPPSKLPPVANAGLDQSVKVGATVFLDGTRSGDPLGLPLHYHWMLAAPSGSTAKLDNAAAAQPSFVADVAGDYEVDLTVDNGSLTSPKSSIRVTAIHANLAPVARTGSDRAVKVGAVVQLDGSGSSDADGDALTYKWTLVSASGSKATLASPGSVMPSFTADVAGAYQVTLVVNDGTSDSAPASITVTASKDNLPPVADAGSDRTIAVGTKVQLDGSKSSDGDGDTLTYKWTLTPPASSSAKLDSTTAATPSFTADVDGQYAVSLVVNDGTLDSPPAKVTITVADKPVANISGVSSAWVGDKIALDGSGSTAPGGLALSYRWSLIAPAGSKAALDSASAVKPSFTIDVAGQYAVSLVVNDGTIDSDAAHLVITAKPHTPPVAALKVYATNCQSGTCYTLSGKGFRVGDTINLDGSQSSATDSGMLSFSWTVLDPNGAAVALTSDATGDMKMNFTPTLTGDYKVTLVVNDGFNDSTPAQATVTLGAANHPPIADAGPDQVVIMGDTVQVPGNLSSDPDGDRLTYSWQLSTPAGSTTKLNLPTLANQVFVVDVPGVYKATLTVFDGRVNSTVSVNVTARPRPVISGSGNRSIATGATITIGDTVSEDGGGALTYSWLIKSGPSADVAQLSTTTALLPKFTPSLDGTYVLELTATDGNGISTSSDTTIYTASPIAKPAGDLSNHYRPKENLSFENTSQGIEEDTLIYSWSFDPAWADSINVISATNAPAYVIESTNGTGDLVITLTITNNNGTHASTGSVKVYIDPNNP
jgi:hypothetical protein